MTYVIPNALILHRFDLFWQFSVSWENGHQKCKLHFWGPPGSKAVVMFEQIIWSELVRKVVIQSGRSETAWKYQSRPPLLFVDLNSQCICRRDVAANALSAGASTLFLHSSLEAQDAERKQRQAEHLKTQSMQLAEDAKHLQFRSENALQEFYYLMQREKHHARKVKDENDNAEKLFTEARKLGHKAKFLLCFASFSAAIHMLSSCESFSAPPTQDAIVANRGLVQDSRA